jgi:hypothetical protein
MEDVQCGSKLGSCLNYSIRRIEARASRADENCQCLILVKDSPDS